MAKVHGPLFSIEARGAIAEAMVHFPWKGRAVVRKWLKPANPQDIDQKIIRQKMAACGKNTAKISVPSTTLADGSKLYAMIKLQTPADNIWNAYFTKTVMNAVKDDAAFTAISAALFATNMTTYWQANAQALGLSDITGSAFATTISDDLQLFMAAYGAYLMGLCDNTVHYSIHPCLWSSNIISQFATDYTAA
jgi:hypothetical protein